MASIMGRDAWWAVPLAVLVGIPMYTNAAGAIPIVRPCSPREPRSGPCSPS